ncbi:MAG: radical SAM protein [Acidobacteriia bacterium]|nr:radical SAM protein [Terriglobia bacterium]
MKDIKPTRSICPECLKAIDATIYEDDGKVFMKKTCPEHGAFNELYWSDYDQYMRAEKFRFDGDGIENPRTEKKKGCPNDCGICPEHKSQTALAIIDVTNRCNLKCPVCFANAAAAGYVYEPTAEQITGMLENLRANRPVPATALQFSGGEPTIRNELFDFIRKAKELGFKHVEINTNGVRISKDVEYARQLKAAGVSTIYLQFDGLTPDVYKFIRGVDLLETKMKAIQNLREAGFDSVVLVVTLVKGVNDGQLGDIVNFALTNFDVVRCINVQPVSLCGRLPQQEREKMRITIPDFMRLVEEQTNGKGPGVSISLVGGCISFIGSDMSTKPHFPHTVHSRSPAKVCDQMMLSLRTNMGFLLSEKKPNKTIVCSLPLVRATPNVAQVTQFGHGCRAGARLEY